MSRALPLAGPDPGPSCSEPAPSLMTWVSSWSMHSVWPHSWWARHEGASDLVLTLRTLQVRKLDGRGVDIANSKRGQMLLCVPRHTETLKTIFGKF